MILHRVLSVGLAGSVLAVSGAAWCQSVTVTGGEGRVTTLAGARIADLPRTTVSLSIHGEDHVFQGALLMDVVKAAGAVPEGPLHGPSLAQAVVVRAADGYAVVFGLAELDAATRADPIILADQADGAPIAEADGPFRLAVQGDLRPVRSARQVTAIEVVSFSSLGETRAAH